MMNKPATEAKGHSAADRLTVVSPMPARRGRRDSHGSLCVRAFLSYPLRLAHVGGLELDAPDRDL